MAHDISSTSMDLATQLRTIAEHARALREAGVSGAVRCGDVEFTLTPDPGAPNAAAQPEVPKSMLEDPTTYGYAEGSQLPGFHDPRKR